ncbi:MAG: hypothetical protein NTX92_08950, partial [Euryarchaeota archaeon]|nr:hypothetical protein [Euryarchaeota archaeon]
MRLKIQYIILLIFFVSYFSIFFGIESLNSLSTEHIRFSDINNDVCTIKTKDYVVITSSLLLDNTSNPGYNVYNLIDNDPNTYFETPPVDITRDNPVTLTFTWSENITCPSFRFYYYHPSGLRYCPMNYSIYADDNLVFTNTDDKQRNDSWTTVVFPDVKCKKITWAIYETYGKNPTKIVINEVEINSPKTPEIIQQENIPYFKGISRFWNDLDWAIAWHIDDVTSISSLPTAWLRHQPLTVMMMNTNINCPPSYITKYHVEYGSHSIDHKQWYGNKGYDVWYKWVRESISFLEYKSSISLWSNKCISFSVPFGLANAQGAKAAYDAGIRIMGNAMARSWRIRPPRNIGNSSNVSFPLCESDWMFVERQGSKPDIHCNWRYCLLQAKQNNSFADMTMHQYHPGETFDSSYFSFIENDTTGWHCTWGEIRSYNWYKKYTTLSYNETASNSTKKVFNIHLQNSDDRIWEV